MRSSVSYDTQDVPQSGTQEIEHGTQDVPQGNKNGTQDTKNGTQGRKSGTQDEIVINNLDVWIECQMIVRPRITTMELALLSGKGLRTIKRHIAKMPHIKYIGSGYSGHWEVSKDK